MTITVVNCHKTDYHKTVPYSVWTTSKDHVYVGRYMFMRDPAARVFSQSKWHNPFEIGKREDAQEKK